MTNQLEDLLRNTFTRVAEEAPAASNLAGTVRAELRRRRQRLARIAAMAVAVLALGGAITWEAAHPALAPPPAGEDGTATIVPEPTARDRCLDQPECEAERVVAALRRPLNLPQLAAGAPCPVSGTRELPQGGGFSGPFVATGPGPVYMANGTTITFDYPPKSDSSYHGTGWGGQKVIWAIDKEYGGPLLFRGRRLDGPQELRFDHYLGAYHFPRPGEDGDEAHPELAYPPQQAEVEVMRTPPSAVRMRAPGCYAIQVDGTDFSEIIVFRAELNR